MLRATYHHLELLLDIDGQEKIRQVLLRGQYSSQEREQFQIWKAWLEGKFVSEFLELASSVMSDYPRELPVFWGNLTAQMLREFLALDEGLALKVRPATALPITCFCYGLDAPAMAKMFDFHGAAGVSFSQLSQTTRAGTGCGSCTGLLKEFLSLQYLKSMGTLSEQLALLEQVLGPGAQEKYVCKCFKLGLKDLWSNLDRIHSGRYPLMGHKCQTCRPQSSEDSPSQNTSTFFYYRGKTLVEWAEAFNHMLQSCGQDLTPVITQVNPGVVTLLEPRPSTQLTPLWKETFEKALKQKEFGDWEINWV